MNDDIWITDIANSMMMDGEDGKSIFAYGIFDEEGGAGGEQESKQERAMLCCEFFFFFYL